MKRWDPTGRISDFLIIAAFAIFFLHPTGSGKNIPIYALLLLKLLDFEGWISFKEIVLNSTILLNVIILFTYLTLVTLANAAESRSEYISVIFNCAILLAFVTAIAISSRGDFLVFSLIFCITVNAAISIFTHLFTESDRMIAWGEASHPVLAALNYGLAASLSVGQIIRSKRTLVYFCVPILLLLTALMLTGSRGPLIAFLLSVIVCVLFSSRGSFRSLFKLGILILTLSAALVFSLYYWKHMEMHELSQHPERALNANPELNQDDRGMFSGLKSVRGGAGSEVLKVDPNNDSVLVLSSSKDSTIGVGWPAIKVEPNQFYQIYLRIRSSSNSSARFYLRMEELNRELPGGITHVSANSWASEAGTVEVSREIDTIAENHHVGPEWSEFLFFYKASENAVWASPTILNWEENGTKALYVDSLFLSEQKLFGFSMFLWLTDRGFSMRPEIWGYYVDKIRVGSPLLGVGFLANPKYTNKAGFEVLHSHNIFISTAYYGGVVGLGLLITLWFRSFRVTFGSARSRIEYIVLAGLVFGVCALMLDGDKLITKVNTLWWVLWLPIGLAAGVELRVFLHRSRSAH